MMDFKTETQLRQEIADAWKLVDQYKAMANLAETYLRDKQEAERKLAVAREALEAAEWNSLDLPEFVRGKIVEALAQIGGDDAR